MRVRFALLSLLIAATALADEPMCGVSPELEARVRERHAANVARGPRIAANAAATAPVLREGAFYLPADDTIAVGGNTFDLAGRSLVFEPRGDTAFATRREPLRYQDPGPLLHDFAPRTGTPSHYVTYDLTQFAFPVFGRSVTRLYLTAFNEIELGVPVEESAVIFDHLESAVHRNPVISPLMITNRKPRFLAYPQLFVRETPDALVVTWKSVDGPAFGYDVQAELHRDGTIVYSYNALRDMKWGTPLLSAGFDPTGGTTSRRKLYEGAQPAGVPASLGALGPMLDIVKVDVSRMNESDVLAVRMTLAAPIDATKLAEGQTVRYGVIVSNQTTYLDMTSSGTTVYPFGGIAASANGQTANISGNTIEFYLLQVPASVTRPQMRAYTTLRPSNSVDGWTFTPTLDVAPRSTGGIDLASLTAAQELRAPISEPFTLPELDPFAVWARLQPAFGLANDYDAVAIYQNFYTDMIFYAGAYSIAGNPQVNGIAPTSPSYGLSARRHPNLLHMNHFTYNYNSAEESASQVILHEFGHRWLYFFRILDGGAITNPLNPVSGHPAAFVHTPAAFPVFREGESSTMGGAVFSQEGTNSWRAKVTNRGYSWADLYLMGLASREEVQPWFYLTGTGLRGEYWPDDNVVVSGEKREVTVDQIVGAHGARNPSVSLSQKKFRVLFVLVTEPGKEATESDVAQMNALRSLFERTFYRATGGRGQVETTYVRPARTRAVR